MFKDVMEAAAKLYAALTEYQNEHPYKRHEGEYIHSVTVDADGVQLHVQPCLFTQVCTAGYLEAHLCKAAPGGSEYVYAEAVFPGLRYTAVLYRQDLIEYLDAHADVPVLLPDKISLEMLFNKWKNQVAADMEGDKDE